MTGHSFDEAVALQHVAPGRLRGKTLLVPARH